MIRKFLLGAAFAATCFMADAQNLVRITGNNVNLREMPSAQSAKAGTALLGMVFDDLGTQDGWTKIKDLNGKEMYISSKFAKPLTAEEQKDFTAELCVMDRAEKEDALHATGYNQTLTSKDGRSEESTTWHFMSEKGKPGIIAEMEWQWANTSGQMRGNTLYYKGDIHGWYIVLTDEVDEDGSNPRKLDEPIYVYPAYTPDANVIVNGKKYAWPDEEWG